MQKSLFLVGCGVVLGLAIALIGSPVGVPVVAQAPSVEQRRCDYTFIKDKGEPGIGEGGQVRYSENWARVVDAGWVLKLATYNPTVYVFERCQ